MIYQPFFGFNRKRNMWNQKGSKNTNKDVGVVTIISLLLLRYLESYKHYYYFFLGPFFGCNRKMNKWNQ